jgi:cytokinesis protein
MSGNRGSYLSQIADHHRSSKVALPSVSSQSSYLSPHSPRDNRLTKFPTGVQTSEGFFFPKPDDDNVIEQMFLALMQKRGWQNLPDQAKRQMVA